MEAGETEQEGEREGEKQGKNKKEPGKLATAISDRLLFPCLLDIPRSGLFYTV